MLAQLNPALPLPGGLAAYMGSLLLRTGDCTTAWREEPIPGISKEAHNDSAQLHRLLFLTLQNAAAIVVRHQTRY